MRVIVTGGAGFVGSHLVEALTAAGHSVGVIDDLSTGRRENLSADVPFYLNDLSNRADLSKLFATFRPEAVVHCGAQTSVKHSMDDPVADMERNVAATARLLHCCGEAGTKVFIQASTAAVYGTPQFSPLTEDHPTTPLSPYGLSKLAAEMYVRLLGEQYGIRWVIFRYANIVGPRQRASSDGAVVPNFLSAMRSGVDPVIFGDGEQTRDFIYVKDVCEANVRALAADISGLFHISSGQATSIHDLWRLAAELIGWRRPPQYGPTRSGDIRHSLLDSQRARRDLGWAARTEIGTALRLTVDSQI